MGVSDHRQENLMYIRRMLILTIYMYIYIHYLYVSTIDGRTLVNELGIEKFRFWEYRESLTFMSIASFISHANEPMDSNGEVRTSSPSSPQRSVTE